MTMSDSSAGTPTPDLAAERLYPHQLGCLSLGEDRGETLRYEERCNCTRRHFLALIAVVERLRDEVARRQRAETFHFDRANRLSAQRQAALDALAALPQRDPSAERGVTISAAVGYNMAIHDAIKAVRAALGATE